ncbi:hypothetical protein L2E82_17223 [Cichorium intybus]|uniref:Uncharacterized protein n=1 Tax=Cichorium intybus TaxID=13427 RepID=A0ACB9F861_CICIN|nr:hypothetical protein L2E82_17223 [Cichorium intybus]
MELIKNNNSNIPFNEKENILLDMSSPALYYLNPRKFIGITRILNSINPNFRSSNRSKFPNSSVGALNC